MLHREVPAADRGPAADAESHERAGGFGKGHPGTSARFAHGAAAICRRRPLAAGVRGASRRQREGGGDPRLSRAQASGEHTARNTLVGSARKLRE